MRLKVTAKTDSNIILAESPITKVVIKNKCSNLKLIKKIVYVTFTVD